jgi:hypothetical protein
MTKEIQLTQGKVALVDDKDFEFLNQFKWFASSNGDGDWYVCRRGRNNGKRITIRMHNMILPSHKGFLPDHKNRDGLDNQRENLRLATPSQNQHNKQKRVLSSSCFKGVSWCKRDKAWGAKIVLHKKCISLGNFKSEIQAALAYDEGAKKYHGEFASPNFIEV